MKIAFLMFDFLPRIGGAQTFTYNLIRTLATRSHKIHLYLPYKSYKKTILLPPIKNVKIFPILFWEDSFIKHFPDLISWNLLLRQYIYKYDVWQVIGAYPAGYISKVLIAKVPIVLRCYGEDIQKDKSLNYGIRLNPILEQKIKETLAAMSMLVALTSSLKNCYLELGANDNKIVEIPNAIDSPRFNLPVDRAQIRSRLGITEDQILILTVGRYHIKKGLDYIPEAAKLLINKGLNIKWLIIGSQLDKLKQQITRFGVEDGLILKDEIGIKNITNVNELVKSPSQALLEYYKSADIFVLPSFIEGLSNVLLEAMAAGLPIVTTDAPGNRDVIFHKKNGLLAQTANSANLAQNIQRLIIETDFKKKILRNTKKFIKRYDWENVTSEYETLYQKLADETN